jgi:hypothetical protein
MLILCQSFAASDQLSENLDRYCFATTDGGGRDHFSFAGLDARYRQPPGRFSALKADFVPHLKTAATGQRGHV